MWLDAPGWIFCNSEATADEMIFIFNSGEQYAYEAGPHSVHNLRWDVAQKIEFGAFL